MGRLVLGLIIAGSVWLPTASTAVAFESLGRSRAGIRVAEPDVRASAAAGSAVRAGVYYRRPRRTVYRNTYRDMRPAGRFMRRSFDASDVESAVEDVLSAVFSF